VIKIEMHFLPDVYVTCDVCKGKRYDRETLEVKYREKSIADVLDMTVEEARELFKAVPSIREKMQTLARVGLDYVHVGQQATTLSGGEAQRVKLSKELSKRATGRTLYILDEPTTGLHFHDVAKLDWVIDMGPEGGSGGGRVVAQGTPEDIADSKESHTGRFLKEVLARRPLKKEPAKKEASKKEAPKKKITRQAAE
jgi:excinuclease ABC subunit A